MCAQKKNIAYEGDDYYIFGFYPTLPNPLCSLEEKQRTGRMAPVPEAEAVRFDSLPLTGVPFHPS